MTRHSDGGPTVTRRLVRDDIFPSNVDNMDSGNIRDDPNNHQVDRSSLISLSLSLVSLSFIKSGYRNEQQSWRTTGSLLSYFIVLDKLDGRESIED